MKLPRHARFYLLGPLVLMGAPAYSSLQVQSLIPSVSSPQVIGTTITWTATASDTTGGLLAYQFNVAPPNQALALVKDFDTGTAASSTKTSMPFVWVPTEVNGTYRVEVVVQNLRTQKKAALTVSYTVNPLVTGSTPVVKATSNPLVALFSAPSCPAGSSMRVTFKQVGQLVPTTTPYIPCHPPGTMTFEIGGMFASTIYTMFSQTKTGGTVTDGPALRFTTGPLPSIPFPTYTVNVPPGSNTDLIDSVLLLDPIQFGSGPVYPIVASNLLGQILWYYNPGLAQSPVLARPLHNGTFLTIESDPNTGSQRYLRQIDLAGNIIKETNTDAIAAQMLTMGVTDGGPCNIIPKPAPVGSACISAFHHDAIQTLPNGQTAALVSVEKIFPAGTQGDTTGMPVDVVGDMILVLDTNWQVVWYFDTFEHDSGAPQLDINRPAVLGETCTTGQTGCPPMFLITPGISPQGKDWLHANAIYYWPASGDLVWSSRHQDWVMKIDYNNGAGTGNILWRLGVCGDFTINSTDSWPWFSHQHDVGIENAGNGPLTAFDNGNTRVSLPGTSTGCMQGVGSGNSRGMALTIDETSLQATPVLSQDLGVFSTASGSAQLLNNGNYFFVPAVVLVNLNTEDSYSIEIMLSPGETTGPQVLNVASTDVYRAWRLPDLYRPPTT